MRQRFNNPFKKALEAIYVFPLPQNAAVSSMRITIGGRTITSVLKSRDEARKIYESLIAAGTGSETAYVYLSEFLVSAGEHVRALEVL